MMIFHNDIFGAPSALGALRTVRDAHGGSGGATYHCTNNDTWRNRYPSIPLGTSLLPGLCKAVILSSARFQMQSIMPAR